MQKHTSKGTSINSKKLPAIYSKIDRSTVMPGEKWIDAGCGRYTDHIRAAIPDDVKYFPWDPYNQTEEVNAAAGEVVADRIICSNVLNVIDSNTAIMDLLIWCRDHLADNGILYVTVYEGDRSCTGKETQHGQSWQRNLPLKMYKHFIRCAGFGCSMHGGVIYAWKGAT